MKKNMKRLGAMILSMLMVLGTITPVFADDQTGSITIHKYEVTDKEASRVAFDNTVTATPKTVTDATPLAGVVFYIEKVIATDNMKASGANAATPDNSWTAQTLVTDEKGEIKLTGLPQGVYRITEKPTDLISNSLNSFLVTIPYVDPADPSNLLYEVHVYPKNTLYGQPDIQKWVTEVDNTADTVGYTDGSEKLAHFIIDVDVPADIASAGLTSAQGNTYVFKVTDTIDSRLVAPDKTNVSVKGISGSKVENKTTKDGTELDPTLYSVSVAGQTVTVTFNNGLAAWKSNDKLIYDMIRIEFDCALSESGRALSNAGQAIPNKAALTYTNSLGHIVYTGYANPDNPYESSGSTSSKTAKETQTVEVHTTAIRLLKVDGNNNAVKLKGAVFGIYSDKACRNPILNSNGEEIKGTSGADGIITFLALPYASKGDANNTGKTTEYYVKELEAPTGYQVYSTVYTVEAGANSAADSAMYTVVNYQEFVLPGTGLTGTHLMMIGLVAIVAGVVGFVCLKKKRG